MARSLSAHKRRLSELVASSGLATFQHEDFYLVSSEVARDPERLILVGGQALEVWGVLLNVLPPTGERSPLTEDADWLGGAVDANWLAGLLEEHREVELLVPAADDPTPNTASMYMRATGGVVLLDFLRCVTGLENDEIDRLAVTIDVPFSDDASRVAKMRVLHPIHCLASRMANLRVHENKRRGNGPMQAVWAVNIVRAYLESRAAHGNETQMRRSCEAVMGLAEYGSARYCYTNYGLDPLAAISDLVIRSCGPGFARHQWPRYLTRVQNKRERWGRVERIYEQRRVRKKGPVGAMPDGTDARMHVLPSPDRED